MVGFNLSLFVVVIEGLLAGLLAVFLKYIVDAAFDFLVTHSRH